jgi:hypothetical protein
LNSEALTVLDIAYDHGHDHGHMRDFLKQIKR